MNRTFRSFVSSSSFLLVAALACSVSKPSADPPGANAGSAGIAGSAGSSAGISGTGSGGTRGGGAQGLLLDDFEDGDGIPSVPGGWFSYDDNANGGLSVISFTGATGAAIAMNGEGYESSRSLEVNYAFDQGTLSYAPYVGVGVNIGQAASPRDLSAYTSIVYAYRGGAHRLQIQTTDVLDYDYFGVDVPSAAGWTVVNLPIANAAQEGWGATVTLDLAHVTEINFALRGATGGSGTLAIDDLTVSAEAIERVPDMTINPPAPPLDATLDSLAITNPLQEKAMRYLNRGYNLTNWLEQQRFDGFTYDEAFVERLAAAGFRALRLPLDLDLYVSATTGTGESLAVEVDPELFEILDSFDAWTSAHGLSLTIDYHQYSTLLDKADPDAVETAVQLWGAVAEHFAGSSREDLFFELLNEPELSFEGTDPTQAEWTAIAERMIAAIRAHDTTHTIIFGDVEWYGIAKLAARAPLSDDNVIYAFHDYDPFVFTHQGASWTTMGSTHYLPYPYDPSRWSEYSSDFGFSPNMESWILNEVRNYYRNGNRSALRNRVVMAKRWGVTNNLPVICNEFGAYDARSELADRARYYTDLVSIFEELEIPWQHWYMIMDEAGAVIPEYREAMGLDR